MHSASALYSGGPPIQTQFNLRFGNAPGDVSKRGQFSKANIDNKSV